MKPLLLLALLLALPALAEAQCYTAFRDRGKALVAEKKYDEAIHMFRQAKDCKTGKPANADREIDALIADANKRKQPTPPKPSPTTTKPAGKTEAQKQAEAQRQAEAAARKADDDAWDIAQGSKTGCQRYLDKYENKNGRHVTKARQCVRDYSDDDGDGVLNKDDRCPREKGPASNNGCPLTDPTRCDGCPEMVLVPGGTFIMGCQSSSRDGECYNDEKPPHSVTVRDFYIGKYEVTVEEFKKFMQRTSYQTDAEKEGWSYVWTGSAWEQRNGVTWRDDIGGTRRPESEMKHPVIHVSWNDAVAYCNWLSKETGKNYRLPTEPEWEFAARGGNKSQGFTYSGSNNLADVAWYSDNSNSRTRPVGTKKPNELGIHDMSGNVWEWVQDNWHGNYSGAPTDGRAWVDSPRASRRVHRGGSWGDAALLCRAAYRNNYPPAYRNYTVDFRLALQFGG